MFFDLGQLKRALDALHEAKRRQAIVCPAPRRDAGGHTHHAIEKPAALNVPKRIVYAYGTHGADFLVVDPETLVVRCGACSGELDATVVGDYQGAPAPA